MTQIEDLIGIARGQWGRWGFSTRPLLGQRRISGTEGDMPFTGFVNDYWVVVGQPTWNGNTPKPWSAAFISYCFRHSGHGDGFPYNSGHAGYCGEILRRPDRYPLFRFDDPAEATVQLGDLVVASRTGDGCGTPPSGFAQARAELLNGGWFCSHADIVVEVRPGEVDVIGGNVSDSVTMNTYRTTGGRITDARHSWIGVLARA